MENQVELENNNQPQPPTYTKGLFLNLQQAFGKENLPDETTFTKKITTDKVYRDGVHKNLIAAYGQDNVPDLSTFDSKVLGGEVKKKEQPVPIEKPSEIFAKSFQSDATKKATPTTSELGVGEEAPIVPSWKMTGKQPLAKEGTFVTPTTKINVEQQEQIKQIQNNALTNTAKNKLSAQGKQATPANISSEIKNIEKAAKDGEVSLVRKGNEYYYGRTPKWHEEFAKQFVNTIGKFTDNIDILVADSKNDPALMVKTLDDIKARKDVESRMTFNVFDMMKAAIDPSTSVAENAMKVFNAEKDKTPLAKPSLAGDIAGFVGGIAPKAMASYFGLVPTAVQAVMTSSQDKIEQLYDKYQQDFLASDQAASAEYQQTGAIPQRIKEAAATRAIKNADIQAAPSALLDTYLFSKTGGAATPQAKNLGEALAKGFKNVNVMGAKGAAAELATAGIEQAQGDKPENIVRRTIETYGNWALMDASFQALPILKSLPKYLSSAVKDFATSKEAKPIVEQYLNKLPNGKEIKAELDKWEEDKKPLEGIVPEDKMGAVAGLNQKIKGLKEKLNQVPESLKEDIKVQIDNTNKQIKDIINSDKPAIDFEKDDLTGEPVGEKEDITQPIELSTELPKGYELPKKPTEVITEAKTTEAVPTPSIETITEVMQPEVTIKIDSESLKKNTQPEVDRVKTLPLENEDGATFNLDGTKHQGGLVVPVESLNTTRAELTPELINDFVEKNKDKISGDNFKVGIYKFPNSEKVSIDLNIVVDPKFKDAALEFGKLAGQESLFDLDSFQNVKTGATGENPKSFTPKEFFDIAKSLAKGEVPEVIKTPEVTTEITTEIKAEPKTVADTVADDLFTHLGIEPEVEPKIAQQELVEKTKLKVDDVKNALSSIAPDIKIELHETVADTEAGAREAGLSEKGVQESKEAGGYYNPNTNTIHLNLEKIKSNTLFHEGVHPILNAIHAIDSKAVDKLFNQVKTIEKKLGLKKKYSEDFASAYDKEQQSMEAVTEFLADFVDGKIKITETNFDKVKQLFVDMMKAVGIDLSNKIKTIQDLKKLADSIAKGFERGDIIRIDESGEPLTKSPIEIKDIQAQKITGEKVEVKEHKLSFVKESDLFDIDKFLKEVSDKKQKIWFWVADQLGRGMYTDKFVNGEHYLDAGASYALDPVNRNKGIIWATGKGNKWIEGKIKESDYIAIISGSPEKSKLFNKQVFDLFGKRIKNYDAFKKDVLKVSNVSEINNLLKEFENFEDLKNNPKRKDLLLAINDQKGKKTPLVDVLNKYNAFLDYNELRDGFYADNDFKMNDIMLVLKPESFGGESKHSTYENDILGKVIGVPNKKINAYDLLPSDVKQKYEVSIAEKNKQRLAEGKAAVSFAESQKAQVVAPYGVGVKEIQYQKPTKGVDLVEQSGKRKEMTEDDKGNYLFFHYSDKKFNKLSPEKVGKHLATGRDERTSVPTSSLYTRPDRLETNVPSDFGYITRVPKEKVYSFTADPLNLMAEAEKRFKKENKDRAFDANNQFAYVAKIASEKGFPITVAEWNIKGTKTLIAKTTEALPLEKYSNIKAGTTNQIEFAKGTEDIKPNAKRRDIKFQKENQDTKIKDFIEMQREKGISDEDIKAGLEKAADRIGLDKNKIDELLTSKKEANAIQKPSPEGILQPTQEGAGEAGGKRTGMEQAEQGAIPPKEGKPSEAEVGGAEEKVGITKKDLKQLEEDYEVDLSQRREKITDVEMQDMAKNLIDSGYDVAKLVKKSLEEEKYVPTDLELNILAEHAADMKAKIDANSSNADIAKYRDILSAINRGTSEAGRALRMAQVKKGVVDSIADVMADMMDDYKVDELTKEQRVDAEERFKVIEDSLNKYKENLDKVNAELEKLKAEKALQDLAEKNKKDTPAKRAKTNDDYTNERKVIIASIKEKWNKASKGGAITAVPLPFSQQLAAIAPDVAKLIGSYLEQGAAKTLDEVRSLLKKDIEDIGIKVTDEEVSRLIAGEGATKKESKNELARQRYEIKEEQKLLLELENLEKFGEPETRKEKIQKNQKLAELRKKIKDLTGEDLDDKFIKTANQRIKANETKLNKIQEKIDAGDFTKEPKPQSVLDSELLQEKNKELYNAYLKSVVDKDEAMLNYERARVNDKIKNESKLNKIGRYADIALNTSKGTVAMFDQSYFLVQMLPFTFSRPLQAIKFAKEALLKDFISADRFKRTMAILHENPLYDLIEKTGLAVFEPRSFKSELRTELHGGEKNLWNKEFEFRGKKYSVGQAFERSTTSFMNNARISLFMNGVEKLYEAGKTFENSPEEFKSLARAINELTGQGKVQEHIQMASPVVNKIIWSPKMFASTLNILGLGDVIRPVETAKAIGRGLGFKIKETETTKGFYSSLTPEQRKFALKEVSRFVGMGVTLMVIAQLSGADDVDVDPRSSGFGTITSGNKTYNVFGRFASAARTIVQVGGGVRMLGGQKDVLGDKFGDKTAGDVLYSSFGRGKMTPAAGLTSDLILNNRKNYFTKEEIDLASAAKSLAIPLAAQDMQKDFKRDNVLTAAGTTIAKLYGANISDKRDFEAKMKSKSKRGTKVEGQKRGTKVTGQKRGS